MTAPPLLDLAAYQAFVDGTGLEQLRLDAIVREIRDYCGWHIAPAVDETLTADGSGGEVQQVRTLMLNSVASVTESGTLLAGDSYEWSRDGSMRHSNRRCWTDRYRGVIASVNHGYEQVPETLISVILDVASQAIASPIGDAVSLDEPEKMGPFEWGGRNDRGVVLSSAQRRVLDRYRIPGSP